MRRLSINCGELRRQLPMIATLSPREVRRLSKHYAVFYQDGQAAEMGTRLNMLWARHRG
jgi:hypothetical protein